MEEQLHSLDMTDIQAMPFEEKLKALMALESGQVVFFPNYSFLPETRLEKDFLSESILDGKHKNISYNFRTQKLSGYHKQHSNTLLPMVLKKFMHNYAEFSKNLIDNLFPAYSQALVWGRTSYRPAAVEGRINSKRKDDTRLHVDAFASSPVYGQRILRVFCNINPFGVPRVWHLGESFEDVLARFATKVPDYSYGLAMFLNLIKATKTLRSAYDHYQLHLHDSMKLDDTYQATVHKTAVAFPADSTWIVYTDQVSHAAISGQYLLEQTFYLPVDAMKNPELSPLKCWEKERASVLV